MLEIQENISLAQYTTFKIGGPARFFVAVVNKEELIEALQEWCRQAEATGIEALREFVKHLKAYVPQPV